MKGSKKDTNSNKEYFSSRWMLLASVLGMAIGTGNIWRFPRILAQNGGGAFLIPFSIFLFLWSIPLIMVEFSMGSKSRKGVIGSFIYFGGKKTAWMGAFVAFCTIAITFYYSVVTGWCIKYFIVSTIGGFRGLDTTAVSESFSQLTSSWQSVGFQFLALIIGCFIIYRGIVHGIEKVNRILVPSLFVILAIGAVRVITLPGGVSGINFLFNPDFSSLKDYNVWLEALSQSAWSTGAGWGLVLTYSVYLKKREDIIINSMLTGFGNNSASLLAGIVIFGTVFALSPSSDVAASLIKTSGKASTGLTFEYMPSLFNSMPGGVVMGPLFFLALMFAAFSSLISHIELGVRNFMDLGWRRKKAVIFLGMIAFVLGLPSALALGFFENQDWVWGLGLMVSGLFFSIIAILYGVEKIRINLLNKNSTLSTGKWFSIIVSFLIPLQFIILIIWWFTKSISWDAYWWNPLHKYTIATVALQWGIVIIVFLFLNKKMVKAIERSNDDS